MPLHKIKDFDPSYRQHFGEHDILKFDVYSGGLKVGSVDDLLVDDAGQFRYFVINTGAWIVGKKVLLPVGRSRIDVSTRCVYADGLSREQVKNLPEYKGDAVDYDYEERVRGIYRPTVTHQSTQSTAVSPASYDRQSYRYDYDPYLYHMNERHHGPLRRSEAHMMSGRPIGGKHRRALGVFPNRQAAEHALHELRDSGFPMGRVSVVARDADKHDEMAGANVRDHVGNKADEGAAIGAVSGGALGGLTGLLVGLGSLAIPGVGPIMLAGATATALATTLAGGAIGAVSGGLLGALIGLGIPEERARVYHDRISRGGYLVIVDGTDEDIARAEAILHRRGIEEYGVYDAPTTHASSVHPATTHTATQAHHTPPAVPVSHTAPTTHDPTPVAAHRTPLAQRSAVGFFSSLTDAEAAVMELRSTGFPMSHIKLVANKFQRREQFAGVDLRDRFEAASLGIPTEQARIYDNRLGRGEYMVIVQGTEDELNRAASMLNRRRIQDWRMYDPTVVEPEMPVESTRNTVPTQVMAASGVASGNRYHQAVGFFSHRRDAATAIADLREAGFPLGQISLVSQRFDQRESFAGIDLRDRFDNSRFGFPEERVGFFNNHIARGDYLVVLQGTNDQLRQAETILNRPRINDFAIYDAADLHPNQPVQNSVERHTAGDVDPVHRNQDPQIGQPHPQVSIIDRRDETRL